MYLIFVLNISGLLMHTSVAHPRLPRAGFTPFGAQGKSVGFFSSYNPLTLKETIF